MASDPVVEILTLIEEEGDPVWLPELYSALANTELTMPMLICPGQREPTPMAMTRHVVSREVYNAYYEHFDDSTIDLDGMQFCLVYSSRDLYESVKEFLVKQYKRFGEIAPPLILNGRQIINKCCRLGQCVSINNYTSGAPKYDFSFDEMSIIQRTPVLPKPKPEPQKEADPAAGQDFGELSSPALEKIQNDLTQLQKDLKDVLKEEARLKAELSDQTDYVNELRTNLANAWNCNLPRSIGEAVEAAARQFSSRLIFHPRVRDIVEFWPFNKNLKCVAQAMEMFKALALVLYEMKFESPDGSINPQLFQNITGLPLAMTERKATKRDKKLNSLRFCEYEGRIVQFYSHLKASIKKTQMRLYFGFLEDERKIIICHVGEHLATSQTRNL